jgi:hypothetical protein
MGIQLTEFKKNMILQTFNKGYVVVVADFLDSSCSSY